jgi:glycosyltransferase involved in cell wall biosynthesis
MKVLVLTNMYPSAEKPASGTFVQEQVEALRKEGIDIDVFLVDGSEHKINYLWGIFRFWGHLLKHRYDLIHAHYVFSGLIARTQCLYPIVLTHHGPEFWSWQFTPCKIITPLVNKVILVSPEMDERLKYKKAIIIPCGIDFDLFRPMPREEARKKLDLPMGKKLVLWAGHYQRPEKRFDIVKAALGIAREKDPSIELVLVTKQPHDVVPTYMNACDALLLVSDAEGSPMVVKEAMACNLPVVSVRVGDVPEVIGGTEGCYLCTQEPADVAEKLVMALSQPRRTNGRENIKHLEQGAIARRIKEVYQGVVKRRTAKKDIDRAVITQRSEE